MAIYGPLGGCRVIVNWLDVTINNDNQIFNDKWFFEVDFTVNGQNGVQDFFRDDPSPSPQKVVPNPNIMPLADIMLEDKPRLIMDFVVQAWENDLIVDDTKFAFLHLERDCVTTPTSEIIVLRTVDIVKNINMEFRLQLQIIAH